MRWYNLTTYTKYVSFVTIHSSKQFTEWNGILELYFKKNPNFLLEIMKH